MMTCIVFLLGTFLETAAYIINNKRKIIQDSVEKGFEHRVKTKPVQISPKNTEKIIIQVDESKPKDTKNSESNIENDAPNCIEIEYHTLDLMFLFIVILLFVIFNIIFWVVTLNK